MWAVRKLLVFFLVYFLLIGVRVFADSSHGGDCSNSLKTLFESAFSKFYSSQKHNERGVYEPGSCTGNVQRLLAYFRAHGVNLENVEVLFLKRLVQIPKYRLYPVKKRSSEEHSGTQFMSLDWSHHMVVRRGSEIIDLDYTDRPQILPIGSYFESMFYPPNNSSTESPSRLKNTIMVTRVPAEQFLSSMGNVRDGWPANWNTENLSKLELLPSQPLSDFLEGASH